MFKRSLNQSVKAGIALTTALTATLNFGCAKQNDAAANLVSTSLLMTGSSSTATVAKTTIEKLIAKFIPSAQALVPPSMMDSQGLTVTLDTAWVIVKEIEFKAEEVSDGAEELEVQFEGPYYVDLLSPTVSALDTIELPAQVYRRVKIKYENDCDDTLLPAGAPAELGNNSMVYKGTVGGNNFSYIADDGVEFEISGAGGISPSDGQKFLVSIQIANVIKQIDMSAVTNNAIISSANRIAAANACPAIDASSNDLYTCFRKGFEQQAELGKDDDGSGEIEADEDHVED